MRFGFGDFKETELILHTNLINEAQHGKARITVFMFDIMQVTVGKASP